MKKRIKPRIIDVIEDDGRWLDPETMEYFEEEQLEDIVNTEDNKNLSFIESPEKKQSPKIKGWVARDKNGKLNFFLGKPRKIINTQGQEYWIGHGRMKQPNEFFPDLRWEDDPIEVELTIHIV